MFSRTCFNDILVALLVSIFLLQCKKDGDSISSVDSTNQRGISMLAPNADKIVSSDKALEFNWQLNIEEEKPLYQFDLWDESNKLVHSEVTDKEYLHLDKPISSVTYTWRVQLLSNKIDSICGKASFNTNFAKKEIQISKINNVYHIYPITQSTDTIHLFLDSINLIDNTWLSKVEDTLILKNSSLENHKNIIITNSLKEKIYKINLEEIEFEIDTQKVVLDYLKKYETKLFLSYKYEEINEVDDYIIKIFDKTNSLSDTITLKSKSLDAIIDLKKYNLYQKNYTIIVSPNHTEPNVIYKPLKVEFSIPKPSFLKKKLLEFYTQMNGAKWNIKWDSTQLYTKWNGLRFDNVGRLIEINIPSNNLYGVLKSDLLLPFKHLKKINLSNNKIVKLEISLEDTMSIENLVLSNNIIRELSLDYNVIENLELNGNPLDKISIHSNSLKNLDLSSTRISYISLSEVFTNIPSLSKLNISDNSLEVEVSKFISDFSNIENIIASRNIISGEFSEKFEFGKIKKIDLSYNKISGELSKKQDAFINLVYLDISNNELSNIDGFPFEIFKNIEYLDISNNQFKGVLVQKVLFLSNIKHLDISFNQFIGEVPEYFGSSLKKLKYLNLSKNMYSGGFFNIFKQSKADTLILSDNLFKSDLSTFELSSNMKYINISNNNLKGNIKNLFRSIKKKNELDYIDLSNNQNLSGTIPNYLCKRVSLLYKNTAIKNICTEK